MKIAIDFIAGSHGNFLETVCNYGFGFIESAGNFNARGTSHNKNPDYEYRKVFCADHYFSKDVKLIKQFDRVISIGFDIDDLLMLSSVSFLRAGDFNINNNELEVNTLSKLSNVYYKNVLQQINQAYPDIKFEQNSIPRYVLREFYKFGFRDPEQNGYWIEQQRMLSSEFTFAYSSFYDTAKFAIELQRLAAHLDMPFNFDLALQHSHQRFLSFVPYTGHKQQCDQIIDSVCNRVSMPIPQLTLFQESYINGRLEKLFGKEMPFHQDHYFNSTKDVLQYISTSAPTL